MGVKRAMAWPVAGFGVNLRHGVGSQSSRFFIEQELVNHVGWIDVRHKSIPVGQGPQPFDPVRINVLRMNSFFIRPPL